MKKRKMIVSRTPLRISLAGGGTDFPEFYRKEELGGCVVSAAINKYIYVIVKPRFDDKIRVGYSKTEIVDTVDEIEHDLVREAMRYTGVLGGVEISTMADIPSDGSGLGSSSSLTVGLLSALYEYQHRLVWSDTLGKDACHIEIDVLGRPIGKQDQYIACRGGLRYIKFNNDDTVDSTHLDMTKEQISTLSDGLLLFYTGISRKADDILLEQSWNTENNRELLSSIRTQARDLRDVSSFKDLGSVLDAGWEFKKQLASKISTPEIDELYQKVKKAGARGGKITGAGGGGFFLVYCPGRQQAVRTALRHLKELRFDITNEYSRVILNTKGV